MPKIRHIAITTEKPEEAAAFYKDAFEMQEVTRNDRQVLLSDGYINLTILKWKTEQDADVGPDERGNIYAAEWLIGGRFTKLLKSYSYPVGTPVNGSDHRWNTRKISS